MNRVEHPRFRQAVQEVEDSIDNAWRALRKDYGEPDDQELAELVLQDPTEFDWRVVDGALRHSTCGECGNELGAGPTGCAPCDLANGFRYVARETDRPGVPRGNEHAIRVASAVARTRHRYSARARCGYELFLPDLLAGNLPTTSEAQRMKALINALPDDELDQLITPADLVRGARS